MDDMEKPLITISLVVFNQEPYLRQAIESCLSQNTNFDYEIIIHDDLSSDNSAKIIREYAKAHPDIITPIIQTMNQFSKGIEINAQIVIPRAKGKYIAFLEADDYWIDSNKLQSQVDFLESHPEVSMCFTATKRIFPNSSKKPEIYRFSNHDTVVSAKDVILLGGNLVDMGSAVVRRSIFDDLPEWYSCIQIWDLTVPLLSIIHGNVFYINKVTSVYRYNTPGSWTQKNVKNYERRKNTLRKSIKTLESYDSQTNFQYHKFIKRKNNSKIIELLLLLNPQESGFSNYYNKLNFGQKFLYKFFKLLGSFKFWKFYRYITRKITGY